LKDEVSLIQNWQTFGMIATASEGYAVQDLFLPTERSF